MLIFNNEEQPLIIIQGLAESFSINMLSNMPVPDSLIQYDPDPLHSSSKVAVNI